MATPVVPPGQNVRVVPLDKNAVVVALKCGCAWNAAGLQVRHCGLAYSINSLDREQHANAVAAELVRVVLEFRDKMVQHALQGGA